MEVTVIIPNFNGKHFMVDCMEALEKQTFRDFEILVVDNGSSDGSVPFLREKWPDVRLIALPENTGFSGAVNIGIRSCTTPYVILLNNDTKVEPDYVGELVRMIRSSDRIFSVSSKMLQMYDPEFMDDAGDLFMLTGWAFQRGVSRSAELYDKPCRVFTACAGAAIYRRDVFDEIGVFDEMHFAYLEDIDVGYRARIAGYENWYCPTAVVHHVGSGTSGSQYNDFKVKLAARNSIYLVYKNMPLLQYIVNFIPLQLGWYLKKRFFIRRGFGEAYQNGLEEGRKTKEKCRKVPFRMKDVPHYLRIEWEMILNCFIYAWEYTHRTQKVRHNGGTND